ncbi:MAG: GH92 family glycosyl hydrolase [Pyrinomonadaceae bacterium]
MKKLLVLVLLLTAHSLLLPTHAQRATTVDHTRWVNPFIGTGGHGHTFPGAVVPFGMVQLSPDTREANWDGSSGYHYSDDVIYGFSHTHLSGTGIPDGCDILFMPTVGRPQFFAKAGDRSVNGYASKFSHANEKAEPGYYSVRLDDDGIFAEMTATKRVGFHRYTFPADAEAKITLDLTWRDKTLMSQIDVKGDRIEGWRRSSSWARDQTIYFAAQFSERFAAPYWHEEYIYPEPHITEHQAWIDRSLGQNIRVAFPFSKPKNRQILLKVAVSYVSIEGARKNLEAELPGWDFDKVRADAKDAWNKELSKIKVSGGTPEQTTNFYTALYHTMIHPSVFNDVDGRYRGLDGKVHILRNADALVRNERGARRTADAASGVGGRGRPRSEQYTVFSLWDTFRAAHPLYTIIDQRRTVDFINTFIRIYEQGGRLPVWELWGNETDTMIGYHAVPVIADAMAKGIKGFDYEKAYEAAKHSAELDNFGLAAYKRRGYISMEDENESVSRTLEYAYDDWCIMSMASLLFNYRSLGPGAKNVNAENDPYLKDLARDIDHYRRRAGNFENLFDTKTGFFRPKRNGGFVEPFAPNEVTFGFTEGNSWQYSFFVPHDVTRLMELMGGQDKFVAKLDELFTTEQKLAGREQADLTGLIGQYAHGNEPSHHIAYLYNYAGRPSKTQKYVRRIMDEFYKPTPDGLIGNEDCGQMSAWYVLSASGFYPVVPGQTRYELGTPLFKQIAFDLENGKRFVVRAPNVSPKNIYVKSARWNGRPQTVSYLVHEQIMAGGVLELEMSDTPNDAAFEHYSSTTVYQDRPAVPAIDGGGRVFVSSTKVSLTSTRRNAKIYYTLDGSKPGRNSNLYTGPFVIDKTTTIKAIAVAGDGAASLTAEATFQKQPNDWTVKVLSGYSSQYTGGGDNAIVDGIRGTTNFASGEWQGVQGKTYEAVVDLRRMTEIKELGASFLQVAGPWIWMPDRVEFEVSTDGASFVKAAEIRPAFPQDEMTPTIKEFRRSITPTRARYVRIRAFNFGKIPSWHPGAGGWPWIFIDEIFVS